MSLAFAELIICLLPGFLGLWVFKRIVQEDIDKRGEFTQVAIALLLSMSAFFFLNILHWALKNAWHLANWISPDALVFPEREKGKVRGLFSVEREFWTSYAALCLLSLFSGGLWAFIREKKWWPTKWLPKFISVKCLKRWPKETCESTLRGMLNRLMKDGNKPFIVRVYQLETYNSGKFKPLIGHWGGFSETEKEIELRAIELCDSDKDFNANLDKQRRCCWINHNSGVVVEFIETTPELNEQIESFLENKYGQWINEQRYPD